MAQPPRARMPGPSPNDNSGWRFTLFRCREIGFTLGNRLSRTLFGLAPKAWKRVQIRGVVQAAYRLYLMHELRELPLASIVLVVSRECRIKVFTICQMRKQPVEQRNISVRCDLQMRVCKVCVAVRRGSMLTMRIVLGRGSFAAAMLIQHWTGTTQVWSPTSTIRSAMFQICIGYPELVSVPKARFCAPRQTTPCKGANLWSRY